MIIVLRRMTNREILGKARKFIPEEEGEEVLLYRVSGTAKSFEVKETNFGESYALKGSFTAQGIAPSLKGKVYVADVCFLSSEISSAIAGNLAPVIDEETGEVSQPEPIDFSFVVSMISQESSATGYVYRYKADMDLNIENPLTAFLEKLPPLPEAKTTKSWEVDDEDGNIPNDFEKISDDSGTPRKKSVKKKGRKKK